MDSGTGKFEAKIVNTGDSVHNMAEFVDIAGEFVQVIVDVGGSIEV